MRSVNLAKPHIDVGLFSVDLDVMLEFWQKRVGLAFEETLPTGQGVRQHRHAMNGSVMKLNHSRDPLPMAPPSGYRELHIAPSHDGDSRSRSRSAIRTATASP